MSLDRRADRFPVEALGTPEEARYFPWICIGCGRTYWYQPADFLGVRPRDQEKYPGYTQPEGALPDREDLDEWVFEVAPGEEGPDCCKRSLLSDDERVRSWWKTLFKDGVRRGREMGPGGGRCA